MTTETPAAELRAAASLLREAAGHATPGPWRTHDTHLGAVGGHTATVLTDRPNINDTELIAWLPTMSHEPWDEARNAWRNAGWMALMDPTVGLALADWLDSWTGVDLSEHGPMPEDAQHALAVARRILGTTEQADTETALTDESCRRFVPDTPRAPGLCASCGDARGWHSRLAAEAQQPETHACDNCDGIDPDTCLTNPRPATAPAVDRATVLREAWDLAHEEGSRLEEVAGIEAARGARCVAYRLRRLAAEAQQPCVHPQGYEGECPCLTSCVCCTATAAAEAQQPTPTFGDIARTIHTKHPDTEHCEHDGEPWPCRVIRVTTAVYEQPTPAPAEEGLTDGERQFLAYALHLADEQMASRGDEFVADDRAALAKLQRLAKAGCTCGNVNEAWIETPHAVDCAATPVPAEETK